MENLKDFKKVVSSLTDNEVAILSYELDLKKGVKPDGLTPQQQCERNHSGQCGVCSMDGTWTGC